MCGIIAYIGDQYCKDIIINGLKRLEYRGYDSAGIAILMPDNQNNGDNPKTKITTIKQMRQYL
ncbi:MAG: hypothetical protein M1308_20925, partial [Actinobacteria bacterium]|nr:hypothetical protein [Actinomycetota bacterium]